ncbi:MAG: ribosomal small subunit protein bTHX [Ignavibacteria bacterium CG2_30_36_16]|nr:30S ribosomal protein THX [Ignavibacteria bacterium]OIP59446.1 MAG: ribosomal small subunit protein bTHX [Ignavibacteria bacterium CG2_30_36_16]PJB01836.1 MAG: 30S ribosomal protein THX [Ignavibacteria bacterium CG_4_9_14_3_um_filter_36_18]
MGKGDRKSKKGKIFRHSFGKSRPRKKEDIKGTPPEKTEKKSKEE